MEEVKKYDMEERTLNFAIKVRNYCKNLYKNQSNYEYSKQLIRSSGSIGANYIEANESLGKKDFLMRIRISRKEAKESIYWLKLTESDELKEKDLLINEATELMKILATILRKSERGNSL